jgi:hypothetical protein
MNDDVQMLKLRVSKFPPPNSEGPGSGIPCSEKHRVELRSASGAPARGNRVRRSDTPRLASCSPGAPEGGAGGRQGLARTAYSQSV